ncbi:MAG: GIY-YIG nuclease family protein [Deltaproteobacteria bacterium]|jgi:Uri superfamily endonuclease
MKPQPGTYALVMRCSSHQYVAVGKRGRLRLRPGFYVYVGSAFGPGGLKARIAHHMKISKKPHWHMDYLRPALTLKEIWFTYDSSHREHQWAGVLAGSRGATIPFSGFGASDCRCKSHLTFFDSRPSGARFRRRLHAVLNPHGKIFIKKPLDKTK